MHIAIIVGSFLPVPAVIGGAVEKVHILLAGAYRAAGHEVTIISRRYRDLPAEEVVDGIRHIRIPSVDRCRWLAANLVWDLIYALRAAVALPSADVTITNSVFPPLVLPRRKAGRIYVQLGRYPKYQVLLYWRADRLQAVSRAVADGITRQAPWLARKVGVIGYAIPDAYFRPAALPSRGKTVLFVGRIAREKGVELLVKAFASMQQGAGIDGWSLRIVGPHEISQGGDGAEYLNRLQRLADALGAHCSFVGPVFDQAALLREYQAAAIFVYPSLAESGEALGLAPLEAMAAGCAVVVSNLRCFDDYVEDGTSGLKFDHRSDDPSASLAAQLARLMAEPGLLQHIAEGGHRAASGFQTAAIAARMLDDFAALCADRPVRGYDDVAASRRIP
ncbi:MAG TPA: glycosyltransferase family 4 protein [Stellaceae bacterium]|nr:glycosyltransferase family 4 protein [Stellaceae bacterium]